MRPKFPNGRGFVVLRGGAEPAPEGALADAAPSGDPTLYLYDAIGIDPWSGGGVTAARVLEQLAALKGEASIDVRINSPGGDVFEGTAIYGVLARFPGKVNVHVDALAASAASLVAMAGDTITTAENAMWMVHRPWTVEIGDAPKMRQTAELLDKAWSSMGATYSRRTGRRVASIDKKIDDGGGEWWMTAEEAVAAGFSDEVGAPEKDVRAFGVHQFRHVPERIAASVLEVPPQRASREVHQLVPPRRVRALEADVSAPAQARRRRLVDALRVG